MRSVPIFPFLLAFLMMGCFSSIVARAQTVPDKEIRVVDFEEMRYSPLARAARIQGVVVVKVTLDAGGEVREAEAISGTQFLVGDCLTNVKKWHFRPNSQKTAVIVYHFELPGGECKSVSGLFMFRGPNLATIIGCDVPVETTH